MLRIIIALLLVTLSVAIPACTQRGFAIHEMQASIAPDSARFEPYANILESSYAAADILASALDQRRVSTESTILSASFVNIDNLRESSTLGRIVAEQISSRLAQRNYSVLEMKLRQESVFIKEREGEFILSRELKNISTSLNSNEVLVGTYAVADSCVFICARIVRCKDNTVLVGHDYQLVLDDVARSLLK